MRPSVGAVQARPAERRAAVLAFAYFFALLAAYYLLRPIREEAGIRGGVGALRWSFTATFLALVVAAPASSALFARVPRVRAVPIVYRFFLLNLVAFAVAFGTGAWPVWVARAFFVWLSVFNLLVVAVFWSFMADLFTAEQARRLFGRVAAGGSLGAIAGSAAAGLLVGAIGIAGVAALAAVLLEVAARCAAALANLNGGALALRARAPPNADAPASPPPVGGRSPPPPPLALGQPHPAAPPLATVGPADALRARAPPNADAPASPPPPLAPGQPHPAAPPLATVGPTDGAPVGGTALSGIAAVFRSSYLLALAAQLLLFTFGSTFLYFQQARIVAATIADPARRTALFAAIDLAVNVGSFAVQALATGPIAVALGLAPALVAVPVLTGAGLLALAGAPSLGVLASVQALRRVAHYALERPARDALFTVVPREQKYKSKAFIDTVVYRGGDALAAWTQSALAALGLHLRELALAGVPLAALSLAVGLWLARRERRLEAT